MRNLKPHLKKSGLPFLLLLCFYSVCFSESVYEITETELNQILAETERLTQTASEQNAQLLRLRELSETLTQAVSEQNNQLEQLRKLSETLQSAAQKEQKRAQIYKGVAIGACAAAAVMGGALFMVTR